MPSGSIPASTRRVWHIRIRAVSAGICRRCPCSRCSWTCPAAGRRGSACPVAGGRGPSLAGSVAVYGSAEAEGGFDLNLMLQRRALIGRTLTPLGRASPGLIDRGEPLRLRMLRDPLRSVNERALLSGANAMAIGDGSLTRWEIIQFANAELVAPDTWQISRRLRGQAGTDAIMPDVWPAGSLVVLLDGGPRQVDPATLHSRPGAVLAAWVRPCGRRTTPATAAVRRSRRGSAAPYAPCHPAQAGQ